MLDIGKHRNILIKILKDIYTDSELGAYLGFKGGTASMIFYNLERFSVDLDFDLLNPDKKEYVFKEIEKILKKYGTIRQKDKKRFTLFFSVSYVEDLTNIKVEINFRDFGSNYEIKSYLGIPMRVMTREDMFAHKLVAMYERMGKANRDIFDVWFFLKSEWPVNQEIIKKRTNMPFDEFLRKCVEGLEKMPNRGILTGMGELLDENQKEWVKESLKDEVVFNLRLLGNS